MRYEYTNGLQTKIIADVPSPGTDQETVYTYGTVKGSSAGQSKIATGHLLQKVAYPDTSSGTDVVLYAYDAQGQFEGFLTTSKYAKLAKCSPDTALRDIRELLERGILAQNAAGGRRTSYRLVELPS